MRHQSKIRPQFRADTKKAGKILSRTGSRRYVSAVQMHANSSLTFPDSTSARHFAFVEHFDTLSENVENIIRRMLIVCFHGSIVDSLFFDIVFNVYIRLYY